MDTQRRVDKCVASPSGASKIRIRRTSLSNTRFKLLIPNLQYCCNSRDIKGWSVHSAGGAAKVRSEIPLDGGGDQRLVEKIGLHNKIFDQEIQLQPCQVRPQGELDSDLFVVLGKYAVRLLEDGRGQ